jgi:hypothetical protein
MRKIKITPEQYKILVNESSPVKGGINRMDKLFTKAVKDADIVDLSEYSQFDIKKSIPNVPNSKMKKNKEIEEPIQENIFSPEFHQAIQNFIENIWTNPSQKGLDRVFVENGITWGDIVTYLTSIGILAGIGGGMYKVKNFFGRKFSNDQATKMKEKQEEIVDEICNFFN